MNRYPRRRFTNGLTSGLSFLAIFAAGYSLSGSVPSALAADPSAANVKPSQVTSIEIPGTFKELSGTTDAVAQKRSVEEFKPSTAKQTSQPQLSVDATKGIASGTPSGEAGRAELQDFHATAYCLKGRTASGEQVRPGVIAADPRVLPIGTVVHLRAGRYTGTYTVLDTGGRIRGRLVDVYVPSYKDAKAFGRQKIKLKVIGRAKHSGDPSRKNRVMADL